jgi:DMSO/TMAO reductase YedYZ molybdopterin-dependent catalytic subunit
MKLRSTVEQAVGTALDKAPKESDFHSDSHHRSVTARVGVWLGLAFTVCFVTGLASHFIQHPTGWFLWPSRPVNLYRVTQGLHVITGIACVPLLLAKMWTVFPKLFGRPLVRSIPHAVERASILVLSGSAFFELVTGVFNMFQNYPWPFFFPTIHYAVAWLAIGSIIVHVAVKLPVIRVALGEKPTTSPGLDGGLSRRGFLRTTWLTVGAAVLATAGGTVPFLRPVSVLANRAAAAPQNVPVNRTAAHAGVISKVTDPNWRMEVRVGTVVHRFSLADLRAMPQTTASLPISCVEGWSASATWTGVPIADLLTRVGARPGATVTVQSLERGSIYASSTLPGEHTRDPLTLLALRLNGEVLDLDHGFPARIIAPSRPGVLQTKWVGSLEVTP